VATELGTAYVSILSETSKLESGIKAALNNSGKYADATGRDIGKRISENASRSMRDGWRPDRDLSNGMQNVSKVGTGIGTRILDGIRSHLSATAMLSMLNPMEIAGVRWAMKAGATIGTALRTAIMGAVTGGLAIAAAGFGTVVKMGLDRLKTLQQSTVQLSLTLKPDEIKQLQSDIKKVVEGTPIPLDKAMQAVPKAISAGLRGDAVKQYIKDIADLTASTGGQGQFDQLSVILEQIRSKGKLAGDELQQLNDAGVDVRGLLKQGMGWDDKTLAAKLKKGTVGIKELQTAIEKMYGSVAAKNGKTGLAQMMGQTFDGAVGALKASGARLGANFIAAILGKKADEDPLGDYAAGITKITDGLNEMGAWVDRHREDIHNVFQKSGQAIGWMGDKLGKIPAVIETVKNGFTSFRDNASAAADAFSARWDAVTSAVGRVKDKVRDVMDSIKTKISEVIESLKSKFDGIFGEDGWFAQQFDKLGNLVDKVRDVLGLGEATANAAAPGGVGDTVPFNPGPMAPGLTNPALTPPTGSREPGWGGPNALPGGFNQSAVFGNVPAGRYVGAQEFASGDVNTLGDLTLGLGDCTSAIQDLVNMIEGKPTAGRALSNGDSFWTGNSDQWAAENGFQVTNKPMPGAFQVGVSDTHAQATLPTGDAFNWGSDSSAAQRGLDGGQGAWFDGATKHYYKNYATGGVIGPGSGTSDSIPAMLSNGEHVLTAKDVEAMGGQGGVYKFRNALHRAGGGAVGFAPGGAVDPSTIQDAQDTIADLNNQYAVAQAQFNELIQKGDAKDSEILGAQQRMAQAKRALDNAQSDLPTITAGGTLPDRSQQNSIYSLTDQLAMQQQQLADLQANPDVPLSQMLQAQYGVDSTKRERNQAIGAAQNPQGADYGQQFVRSLGFIPAAAASNGVAGTSSLSGFINMGNSVVSGAIDTGVNLANMAASAAITAGLGASSFGAAAAAGPAASIATSYGLQLAGNEAKTISKYWFGLAGIGADAAMETFSPFGMPRWLGYDYGNYAPQLGIQQAALSTIEKMGGDAIKKQFAPKVDVPPSPKGPSETNTAPSGPSAAATAPVPAPPSGTLVGPNDPGFVNRGMNILPPEDLPYTGAGGNGGGGSWAKGGAISVYDQGGMLPPGGIGINMSARPEPVLTPQQWDAMMASPANSQGGAPLVQNLYAQDMQDAIRQLDKVKRRDMMQYAGRP
jgi:tape measure domain-containing protein